MNKQNSICWQNLQHHYSLMEKLHMRDFFKQDANRFKKFSLKVDNILLDYSKNIIRQDTLNFLIELAQSMNLAEKRDKMFNGEKINITENRAVLHTALRSQDKNPLQVNGENVRQKVNLELKKMKDFSNKIRNGDLKGCSGKPITDIVNVGIGGSDLGPRMVCSALKHLKQNNLKLHFLSNVDYNHFSEIISKLNHETSLFIINSKTFTTQETITNANSAKVWFLKNGGKDFTKHFIAVTTNYKSAKNFGISNIFNIWDWVGGRYSLWSAVGLIIMIAIGYENFTKLLQGAYKMDKHFLNAPFNENMPVIMGLLSIWYNNFFNSETHAVLPYDENLKFLPPFLEQLEMESNGKSIDINGDLIETPTGCILWGAQGINGQHAFYQLLHQSLRIIPTDFIISLKSNGPNNYEHQSILMANFIAQTEALMTGRNKQETKKELHKNKIDNVENLFSHMTFNGNNPSNSLILDDLTPESLGNLIAMYEHKVFVQGVVWNINSYDQWGVELGKTLTQKVLQDFTKNEKLKHDCSTNALIKIYKNSIN